MKIYRVYYIVFCACIAFYMTSCGGQLNNQTSSPTVNNTDTIKQEKSNFLDKADEAGRLVWQKPEAVIDLLGDLSGKTIADIGAGSGFFTIRFALKSEKVLAIDIDSVMLKYIETIQQRFPSEFQDKIETRLALEDDPLLEDEEVDIVVIINTIAYIEDRPKYLSIVKDGLKPGGIIMILDYKMKQLAIEAPPSEYRVSLNQIENDLQSAGYTNLRSDDRTLDYQYIVFAEK